MKLEFDTTDMRQVGAVHALMQALMGIRGDAPAPAKPASPPKAAASATPSTTAPSTVPSAPTPTPTTTAAPAAAAAPTADAPSVDLAGLSSLFQTFVKAKGPGAAKALLAEIGVSKVVDIPPDQFAAFAAKLAV